MASHLRRWALELAGSFFFAYFLFAGVLYDLCVHYRPRVPLAEKGWISPVWTKFGTCYTSAYDSQIQDYVFFICVPVFVIAAILQSTYRENWVADRTIGENLHAQRMSQDRNLNPWRSATFFIAEIAILCVFWWWT